jgi:hypothetical protein
MEVWEDEGRFPKKNLPKMSISDETSGPSAGCCGWLSVTSNLVALCDGP